MDSRRSFLVFLVVGFLAGASRAALGFEYTVVLLLALLLARVIAEDLA